VAAVEVVAASMVVVPSTVVEAPMERKACTVAVGLAVAAFVGAEVKVTTVADPAAAFTEAGVKVPTVAEDTLPVPMESQAPRLLTVPSTRILAAAPPIKDLDGATRLKEPMGADTHTALMEVKLRGDRKAMGLPEATMVGAIAVGVPTSLKM
jgi:hypothetical protein